MNEDDFQASLDKCNSESERSALITDTLNGLYNEAGKNYKENNASVIEARKANSDYTDSMAELGEKVEPITTKIKNGFNKILEKVLELTKDVDIESFGKKVDKAFETFIKDIMPKIIDGLTWIKDNKDVIIAGIVAIGAAFAAFKVVTIIQAVTSALQGMTLAQAALNLVMSLNPIGLIVAAVAALVAGFIVLWKKCDAFREFWIGLWDGIKEAVGAVVDWVKENWKTMLLFITSPLAGVFKYCYDHFDGFRNFVNGVVEKVKGFFTGLWDGIKTGAKNAWDGIKSVFSTVADFFGNIFTNAWNKVKAVFSVGGKIFDGIKDGIITAFKTVVNGIITGINKVVKVPFEGLNGILDKIQGLSIAGLKPFDWMTWRAPIPEIPQLARGGVVNRATNAIIGEDGAEAVVPLEKNTEWIDKVADKIASKQKSVVVNQTNNYSQSHSRLELYKTKQQTAAAVRLAMGTV